MTNQVITRRTQESFSFPSLHLQWVSAPSMTGILNLLTIHNLLPAAAQNLFILPLGCHCHSLRSCLPAPLTATRASFLRWNPMSPQVLPMPLAKAVDGLHSCVASMRASAQIFFLLASLHAMPTFLPISSEASVPCSSYVTVPFLPEVSPQQSLSSAQAASHSRL